MKKIIMLLLGLYAGLCHAQIKFTNPILSGFYPDPSVTKVGSDYYLVNSTFAYFPGIPVFHSKDLKNWKQIGNVIDRPTQMTFFGDRTSRGLFAPSINYYNGTYYMTCTNIDKQGNFVMTAKNPAGHGAIRFGYQMLGALILPCFLIRIRHISYTIVMLQIINHCILDIAPYAPFSLIPLH